MKITIIIIIKKKNKLLGLKWTYPQVCATFATTWNARKFVEDAPVSDGTSDW